MIKHVIIAGSEKCGTTSLFQYLSDAGTFRSSKIKETDYFRLRDDKSLEDYEKFFCKGDEITLEASPGYLSESVVSSKNIVSTLGSENVHLVFCLRDPVDRLFSSFSFHKSRLYLDKNMNFNEFVSLCFQYEQGLYTPSSQIEKWCLEALKNGKYFNKMQPFLSAFSLDQMTFIGVNKLGADPYGQIEYLLNRIGLPVPSAMKKYQFKKSNKTSSYNVKIIHRYALSINKYFEKFFLKSPHIKRYLLNIYSLINGKKADKCEIDPILKSKLISYYDEDMNNLIRLTGLKEIWRR